MVRSGGSTTTVEAASVSASTDRLVAVTSKKYRLHNRLMNGRSSLEVRLALAVLVLSILFLILIITLIVITTTLYETDSNGVCISKECVQSGGMLLGSMDQRVSPCDDFYRFSCGQWGQAQVASSSQHSDASWFSKRFANLNYRIIDVLEENITAEDPKAVVYAKQLYLSCVDTDRLDQLGLEPVISTLENVSLPTGIPDRQTSLNFNLARVLARTQRVLSMDIIVQLSATTDPNTDLTIFSVGPGLGLSSLPEIVSEGGGVAVTAREALTLRLAYITAVLSNIQPTSNVSTLAALALKILLADSQLRSDIHRTLNNDKPARMTFHELQELMDTANVSGDPLIRLDWKEYLTVLTNGTNVTLGMNDTVFVENKQFFIALAQRLHKTKPETCERYVWWKVLSAVVPHSSSEIRQLRDDFYEALLKRPPQPRPVRCVKYVKSFLNMAISYKFAMDDNMEATSERVREMLNDITDAFNRLVDSLSWMDDKTKSSIRDKASNIGSYIGYPNWLLQPGQLDEYYKHVEVIDGQFLRSMIRIKSTEVGKVLASIGTKPENATRDVWMSDPLEVNAFYSRSSNAVAIPAGILQSPFYYLGIEALNYGAIGTILGHELTHAFDVEGKDYDKKGRRNSWWTDDMTKEYNSRADCFVKQYQQYKIVGKYQLNGTLTLAENIADNGGVREALHAYRAHLSKRSRPEPKLPPFTNFTNEQLFFLAFANVWCETTSEESALGSLSDVHSPNRFRVIGTLANLQEFAEAWQCPPGSNMNPQDKCVLW